MDKSQNQLGNIVQENIDLRRYSSYKIGGKARFFVNATNAEHIQLAFDKSRTSGLPLMVLGNGSNLLLADSDLEALVLRVSSDYTELSLKDDLLIAPAGAKLLKLVKTAREYQANSLDFLAYIPGHVGGSVVNNAGAFGSNLDEHLQWVEGFTLSGSFKRLYRDEIQFGYRHCELRGRFIVTKAAFRLGRQNEDRFKEWGDYRKRTQPTKYPSSGCVFKNPTQSSAGLLIEQSGCKGLTMGDAQVSTLHANFIINLGRANSQSVQDLIKMVSEKVYSNSGVKLERELQFYHEAFLDVA